MCSTPFHVIFNEFEIIIIFILLSLNCPNDIIIPTFERLLEVINVLTMQFIYCDISCFCNDAIFYI